MNTADVRTVFANKQVLCLRCAHCLRTLFATSVLSAYTVRSHYAVSELPARLDVCTIKCRSSVLCPWHPYSHRTASALSTAIRGKFRQIRPSATASVLNPPILTKFRTIFVLSTQNFVRTLSASIRSVRAWVWKEHYAHIKSSKCVKLVYFFFFCNICRDCLSYLT